MRPVTGQFTTPSVSYGDISPKLGGDQGWPDLLRLHGILNGIGLIYRLIFITPASCIHKQ